MGAIVVLGGAGGVGRVAVEALTHIDAVDEVVVTDLRAEAATAVVAEITADPDWKLQTVVLTVVLAFLLAGLVAWLLGP